MSKRADDESADSCCREDRLGYLLSMRCPILARLDEDVCGASRELEGLQAEELETL
jgi:hypothetical protein